ncbi:hypothetical protein BDK51DRAFT_39396 [Blyttiomyces helicus]|uniref:Uncharacterized protein n=1 Tax=Blyttiomyces helicus TaxID=388810 RepID=A0A4P9WGJ4_9FUNG|nr:hypothetical protein BDK51DRAFT_39396 [Blyttiomyces helicus]|eukprot:RKO90943.1 hypothetical protein BDK51DRAFT_39396 [Blyttiomyces helicus]
MSKESATVDAEAQLPRPMVDPGKGPSRYPPPAPRKRCCLQILLWVTFLPGVDNARCPRPTGLQLTPDDVEDEWLGSKWLGVESTLLGPVLCANAAPRLTLPNGESFVCIRARNSMPSAEVACDLSLRVADGGGRGEIATPTAAHRTLRHIAPPFAIRRRPGIARMLAPGGPYERLLIGGGHIPIASFDTALPAARRPRVPIVKPFKSSTTPSPNPSFVIIPTYPTPSFTPPSPPHYPLSSANMEDGWIAYLRSKLVVGNDLAKAKFIYADFINHLPTFVAGNPSATERKEAVRAKLIAAFQASEADLQEKTKALRMTRRVKTLEERRQTDSADARSKDALIARDRTESMKKDGLLCIVCRKEPSRRSS